MSKLIFPFLLQGEVMVKQSLPKVTTDSERAKVVDRGIVPPFCPLALRKAEKAFLIRSSLLVDFKLIKQPIGGRILTFQRKVGRRKKRSLSNTISQFLMIFWKKNSSFN